MTEEKQKQVTALVNWFLKEHMTDKTIGELCIYDLLDIVRCVEEADTKQAEQRHEEWNTWRVKCVPIEKV